jgi:hypothetical protein
MEPLLCPLCRESLEPAKGRHGLVWVCRACRAGAATLPILRQVASRTFVNQLWQAALHHGRPSAVVCPACTQPFTEFAGASAIVNPQLKVCVRCFWVWFSPEALSSRSATATLPPALGQVQAVVQGRLR